ncbi:alpha/beta hydrolase [Sphingopyxis sp. MWB1]|uniref:alpha/beta hydrolase n=1 Tax=Sphingopyxis sp. MWB1 TaxID=1537715 RepID=UPI0006908AE6|nr:alpha/beta hydrolase [Sphingopyxis sp. MWB1]
MIKFLLVTIVLLIALGGAARLLVAGGAKSLEMADRIIGPRGGAGLRVADQPYGREARRFLDIWAPDNVQEGDPLPVIVFFYGGGWDSGQREYYGFIGRALAREGFMTVIPDYRLVPQAHWPDFLEDGAAAIAWTRAHVGALGGDPDRIALMGHSAGAYIAAMLALDPTWLQRAGSDPADLRGVAALAGPYDFLPIKRGDRADRAMGQVRPAERTQPVSFARGDAPPFWLASGEEDRTVRPRSSRQLAAAIRRAGGSAVLRLYPRLGHAGIILAMTRPFRFRAPVLAEVSDFLRGVTGRRLVAARAAPPAAAARESAAE